MHPNDDIIFGDLVDVRVCLSSAVLRGGLYPHIRNHK